MAQRSVPIFPYLRIIIPWFGPSVFLVVVLSLSSAIAADPDRTTPLDAIEAKVSAGELSRSEADLEKTYYLMGDGAYDAKRFGEAPRPPAARYDCSATHIIRQMMRLRGEEKNYDPYGMLLQPWLKEADRLAREGEERLLGSLGNMTVRLLSPPGRLRRPVPSYRMLADTLADWLKQRGSSLSAWQRKVFGKTDMHFWGSPFTWPPASMVGQGPYLESYFDKHPEWPQSYQRRWDEPLRRFLKIAGVGDKMRKQRPHPGQVWTWILSDRIERHAIIWTPAGESLLFLSVRCLDRALDDSWLETKVWQATLVEGALHEVLQTFYLQARPQNFYRDPWSDAVVLAAVQSFLPSPGQLYQNSPFFTMAGRVAFGDVPDDSTLRLGTAPSWNFLSQVEGIKLWKEYFSGQHHGGKFLAHSLDKKSTTESRWLSFAIWALAYPETPEALREGLPLLPAGKEPFRPQGQKLEEVKPPRGTLGLIEPPLAPQSFHFFNFSLERPEEIAALRIQWTPAIPALEGYLVLARAEKGIPPSYLGFAPLVPGSSEEVIFDPEKTPTEAYFIAIHRGHQAYATEPLRLQVTVIPRKKLSN